jgi:hypothetical protein
MSNRVLSSAAIDLLVYSEQLRAKSNFLLDKSNVIKNIAKQLEVLELNINEKLKLEQIKKIGEILLKLEKERNFLWNKESETLEPPDEIDENRNELSRLLWDRASEILEKDLTKEEISEKIIAFVNEAKKKIFVQKLTPPKAIKKSQSELKSGVITISGTLKTESELEKEKNLQDYLNDGRR